MTHTARSAGAYRTHLTRDQTARLEAAANRALYAPGYPELWNLRLKVDGNRLVLHGAVSTYYMKQLAQQAVMTLEEVAQVTNRVVVRPPV